MKPKNLDDYETGEFVANIPIKKKWRKEGASKSIEFCYGKYIKIGDLIGIFLKDGTRVVGKEARNDKG